jgi:hypothetical protein
MIPIVVRVFKSIALAAIMYFSILSFGFADHEALIASLIPLLLGLLNVAAGLAYSSTSLVMILAIAAHLLPAQTAMIKNASKNIQSAIDKSTQAAPQAAPQGPNQMGQ